MATLASDQNVEECVESFREGFRPPPNITVDKWADKHRTLSRKSSGIPGQWKTSRVPYTREIMFELSHQSHADDVVWMKGSQVAGTEVGINMILSRIDIAPVSILAVYPTIDMAKKYSRIKLQPSITENERLRGKIKESKSRDSSNTVLQKDYPGGTLIMTGANSSAGLRMLSAPVAHFDEIDEYPDDVDGQGDPLTLAEKRTSNFSRKKRFYTSTPTTISRSRIYKKFLLSDQRYYYIPCPYCKKPQRIKFENIHWEDEDNPEKNYLECIHCHAHIEEYHKTWMLEHGRWIKHNPKSKTPGFHLSALYAPLLGWFTWTDAIKEYLKSIGDPLLRIVFKNTVEGLPWDESETTIDSHWLAKRKEHYTAVIPQQARVLTAGVDTQKDRLECTVLGHGIKNEVWVIEHRVFLGDPSQETVWEALDQYLLTQWEHESGEFMNIATTCIDAMGDHTDDVYEYCKSKLYRRVFPTKGMRGPGRPIVASSKKNKRQGVYLIIIGVDSAKFFIYENLKKSKPGPGYIHFPDELNDTYFEQLTSEKRKIVKFGGLPRAVWELPSGKRNEALDCFVYGVAALKLLNPNIDFLEKNNKVLNSDFSRPMSHKKRRVRSPGVKM